jgi:hypothetical protein
MWTSKYSRLIKGKNQLNNKGNLEGPIPYEITWRLMLLKVLHKPLRPIRIFIPKSMGKGDNHNKENIIMKLKHGGFSRVQYLMGLHRG